MNAAKIVSAHLTADTTGDVDRAASLWFNLEADAAMTSLLVSEWNTVCGGQVASSPMVFDTGRFRGAGRASATVVHPIGGTAVDTATAGPAHHLPPGSP